MAVVRKKQDDKILKTLRELVSIGGNKECFDCGQKGPTYINMTIGSFVCTTCSGILRGITPPHRVKSISMATFTQEEIDFVRQNGNDACSRTWLGLWDPKRAIKQEHRDFMIDKYERKRYYLEPASPLKSLPTNGTTATSTATASAANNNINGSSTNINGNSSSSSSSKNCAENLVPLKTITLTPPTSLRLSRTSSNSSSGLANGGSNSHTGSSTNLKFQQQFTPDDSNFFSDPPKILPPTPQKHSSNHHQRLNGTVNGSTFERNQKNGLLTSTNNNNNAATTTASNGVNPANKFTPDTDFVADFSNANIIVNNNGLKNGGSNHRRLSNGFSENGNGCNGQALNGNGSETENFADFEHNTIYNAAGLPISASSRSSSALSSATPSVDRYAALKDLDDQFREIKFESETNNNTISSSSHSNGNNTSNGLSNGLMNGNHTNDVHQVSTANPFKTANPFQQPQQQQQTLSWAIPGSTPPSSAGTTNGFYASSSSSSSPYQNGFVHPATTATANLLNGNGVVGFTNAFQQHLHQHPASSSNGSSNGYGGHIPAQIMPQYGHGAPVNHFGHFGNPFMAAGATTATSNNPFL